MGVEGSGLPHSHTPSLLTGQHEIVHEELHHAILVDPAVSAVRANLHLEALPRPHLFDLREAEAGERFVLRVPKGASELYRVRLTALEQKTPFRLQKRTAWPRVAGYETALVDGPKLIRRKLDAISGSSCIALRTWLSFIAPLEQALPAETAIPARSSCIIWAAAGKGRHTK